MRRSLLFAQDTPRKNILQYRTQHISSRIRETPFSVRKLKIAAEAQQREFEQQKLHEQQHADESLDRQKAEERTWQLCNNHTCKKKRCAFKPSGSLSCSGLIASNRSKHLRMLNFVHRFTSKVYREISSANKCNTR